MRRALLVFVPLIAWPGSAAARPGPTLTLKAPGATAYLHRIEFVGRISPTAPGARVHLFRGAALVATVPVRGDGSFRIPVRLASPGPFHVAWLRARSSEVTVRIRPRLDARLVGSSVAGAPLRLEAALTPAGAGQIRVQVIRSGEVGFDARYAGQARVSLGTKVIGALRVRLTVRPKPGYDSFSRELRTTLRPPNLSYGTTSPAVTEIARRTATLHYVVPSFSSTFGEDLIQSVYAFQKVQGLERTGAVGAAFWTRLEEARIPNARYSEPADHIEVDKTHQVLYLVRGGKIALISPVSTAGIAGYYTPRVALRSTGR